jgi:hypothetical protein
MLWLCSRFNFKFEFEFEFSGKFLEKFEKFLIISIIFTTYWHLFLRNSSQFSLYSNHRITISCYEAIQTLITTDYRSHWRLLYL